MGDTPKEKEEEEELVEDNGQQSEHYDSNESEDDIVIRYDDGNVNSKFAVGYKYDRSFVVRGSKIGVFEYIPNKNFEFSTNISKSRRRVASCSVRVRSYCTRRIKTKHDPLNQGQPQPSRLLRQIRNTHR